MSKFPALDAKLDVPASPSKRLPPLGRKIPDLVVIRDSESPTIVEFRVQLEVRVKDKNAGDKLQHNLKNKTEASLRESKKMIADLVATAGGSQRFSQIVVDAFDDNIRDTIGPAKGRKVPNLIVVQDAERGKEKEVEFRVQLEVMIEDEASATTLDRDIEDYTPTSLRNARDVVRTFIPEGASPTFTAIIDSAFEDNVENAFKRGATSPASAAMALSRWGAGDIAEAAEGAFQRMVEQLRESKQGGIQLFPNGVELIELKLNVGPNIGGSLRVAGKDAKGLD
jgi:hypothetical protein